MVLASISQIMCLKISWHLSSQITRTWSLESCEKVTKKCRESAWNSRRSKLRSPDIAHIFAECHLILSPLGSLSYNSPDNICNHFGQHYTIILARFLDTII